MNEEPRPTPLLTLLGFLAFLVILALLAASVFTFGATRSPQDYAEATLMIPATQTALPFAATQRAEDNRHQAEVNAMTEAGGDALLLAGKCGLGLLVFLGVFWSIAGSFKAGSVAVHAGKQAALPASMDLGDGYRLLHDGTNLHILDVRTGRAWLATTEDVPALEARTELEKAQILADSMVAIAKATGQATPADWMAGMWLEGGPGE
jgi:hypothetical protein